MNPLAIYREFESRGIKYGSMLLLRPTDAVDMVIRLKAAAIPIYGFEAFSLQEGGIRPLSNHNANLSASSRDPNTKDNCWSQARRLLLPHLGDDMYFEINAPF